MNPLLTVVICCVLLNEYDDDIHHKSIYYPVAGRGTGYCNRAICFFVSLFVSLSATLRENGWTDLHEIFREGVE